MKKYYKGKLSVLYTLLAMFLVFSTFMVGCSRSNKEKAEEAKSENQEINLFIAASLSDAVGEIVRNFESENKDVKVLINADSSGKLKTQIVEGFDCDIFLSASTKEVEELQDKKMIVDGSVEDVLENQLAIIAPRDYTGAVKGLENIREAKSIALPYASVPAGFYARKAMVSDGIISLKSDEVDEKAAIKSIEGREVSSALGGVTISEKDNVSSALSAVAEKSTDIGFTYVSDAKRNDGVKIISLIDIEKTGKIKYPIAKIKSKKSDKLRDSLVDKLYKTLTNDAAKKVYTRYGFKVD